MKNDTYTLKPIGIIRTPFTNAKGTPIQPSFAGDAQGTVEVFAEYTAALRDLDGFDRIWLLYWFDRIATARLCVTPYRDVVERGLFSTRAPCRPNPIGLSSVELVRVDGTVLHVRGIDVLDGTPLLDIKPYVPRFDVFDVKRTGWLDKPGSARTMADERFHDKD